MKEMHVLPKYFLIYADSTVKLHACHIFKRKILVLKNVLLH